MNGTEFLRRLRALGRRRGVRLEVLSRRGKGSHVMVWFGARRTTLKDRKKEIGPGLLGAMCRQLGITPDDLSR